MSDYRRWYVPGGTYFFTAVAHRRRRFLSDETPRGCLRDALETIRRKWPFTIVAICLLPDHLHTVWALPAGDAEYPVRWKRIKEEFTRLYLAGGGFELPQSRSRRRHGMRGIWQKRYWEHTCMDENDLRYCVDYTH
ncbi:MAG: REP-associated tyrosine transposase [Thermoguttaceae bacterium]